MRRTHKNKLTHNKTKKQRVFKKGDFYSGDGFLTKVWGPTQWHMLHTISFNYPIEPTYDQQLQYKEYVLSLKNVLPCGACRKNLAMNLKQMPLTMSELKNRDTFSRYIYNLHELVNKMLKKQSHLTYCDVRERYEHFRSRCSTPGPKLFPNFVKSKKNRKPIKEKGCSEPLYGNKSRCIIKIVPQEQKGQTIQIDKKCVKHRV
jgi:hypothetical protein